MCISIFGAMVPHIGSVKRGFGRQKKLSNGLRFSQRIKSNWHVNLLLLPRQMGNEFVSLKESCKPLQLSNLSLLVSLKLLKLAIWMSSFQALILLFQNFLIIVAFLSNLLFSVKMFPRFSMMMIRLQMIMRRFKGFLFGRVIKALIFPKPLIPLYLLCLILSLEKLIMFGAWEVVSVVLTLITPGVIVPPLRGAPRVLRGVTNSNFVKPEAGQGFFGGPRSE
jgi:hypothetical protein